MRPEDMQADGLVNSADMMRARERRAAAQAGLRERHGCAVISFTLNIPGAIKTSPLIAAGFREGRRLIAAQLKRLGLTPLAAEEYAAKTGYEALWAVDADARLLKQAMLQIETDSALGRLFDIDVLDRAGQILSRASFDLPARRCLLCDQPAPVCARLQRHDAAELRRGVETLLADYFRAQRADAVAATACRAMLYEVSVTPKPGLVDRADNGAHQDMDFFTFLDSGSVLAPCFRRFFLLGAELAGLNPPELFGRLRYPGMQAEDAMRAATRGVNTHKGLIFSFGLLCAGLGWLYENRRPDDAASLLAFCADCCGGQLTAELERLDKGMAATAGERLYLQSGHGGVRSEAVAGYPSVRDHALPALKQYLAQGHSLNDAGALTLLVLLGETRDSNVYSRRGLAAAEQLAAEMRALMRRETLPDAAEIAALNQAFIRDNISPGGAADLLAVTFFLHFLSELPPAAG